MNTKPEMMQPQTPKLGNRSLRRLFVIVGGVTTGSIIAVAALAIAFAWYSRRQSEPRPWNREAVTATFNAASVNSETMRFTFSFVLENHTEEDFALAPSEPSRLVLQLKKQDSIFATNTLMTITEPIFIPPGRRSLVNVTTRIPVPNELALEGGIDARERDSETLNKYRQEHMKNLAGFILYAEKQRYEIVLPFE